MEPRFCVKLLGGISFKLDGQVPPDLRKPGLQLLLSALLLFRRPPLSREQLAARLWPAEPSDRARASLRVGLLRLRRALPDPETWLEVLPDRICWRVDSPYDLDVVRLEALLSGPEGAENLEKALKLYPGELLPGRLEDWVLEARRDLDQRFQAFMRRGMDRLECDGNLEAALRLCEAFQIRDPLSEEDSERLMRLQARTGQRQAALTTYERHRLALQAELGAVPSEGVKRLRRTLLMPPQPAPPPVKPPRLCVGREAEARRLDRLRQEAFTLGGRVVVLEGEAGVGKTHLAERFLEESTVGASLTCRCFEIESHLAFGPVLSLLRRLDLTGLSPAERRVLSSLLPELLDGGARGESPSISGPWQWRRLLETAAQAVLTSQPLTLLVDDFQWCDEESLAFLSCLLERALALPCLLLLTLRTEGLSPEASVARWLATQQARGRLTRLPVGRFGPQETGVLLDHLTGKPTSPARAQLVFEGTQGNALSIVSMVQEELETGRSADIHASFRRLVERRLARLTPEARELLELLATYGSDVSNGMLLELCRRGLPGCLRRTHPEPADARPGPCEGASCQHAQELLVGGLLSQRASGELGLSHALIQEVATSSLRAARRRRLHLQLARLQVALGQEGKPIEALRVAQAFEVAGAPLEAAHWYLQTAHQDLRLRAVDASATHFSQALRLAEQRDQDLTWAGLMGRARCRRITSDFQGWEEDIQRLEALARAHGRQAWLADAAVLRGRRQQQQLDPAGAEEAAREALHQVPGHAEATLLLAEVRWMVTWNAQEALQLCQPLLEQEAVARIPGLTLRVLRWVAVLHAQAGRESEALAAAEQCLILARQADDPVKLAEMMALKSSVLRKFSRVQDALTLLEDARVLVAKTRIQPGEINPVLQYGETLLDAGRLSEAARHLEEGILTAQRAGMTATLTGLRVALAEALRLTGQWTRAWTQLEACISHYHLPVGMINLRCSRARLALEAGWLELAGLELAQAEQLPPRPALSSFLACTRGQFLLQQGDLQGARSAFLKALGDLPASIQGIRPGERLNIRLGLAQVTRLQGDPASALRWLEPLIHDLSHSDEGLLESQLVWLEQARCLQGLGRRLEARAALERARRRVRATLTHLETLAERQGFTEQVPANREILTLDVEGGSAARADIDAGHFCCQLA